MLYQLLFAITKHNTKFSSSTKKIAKKLISFCLNVIKIKTFMYKVNST